MFDMLHRGGLDSLPELFVAYTSLLDSMECGGLDRRLISRDLWGKLIEGHVLKTWRYEVKLPYPITKDGITFTATLVLITQNAAPRIKGEQMAIKILIGKEVCFEMFLENTQIVNKVLNRRSTWQCVEDYLKSLSSVDFLASSWEY